jgi:hypothetical protein
VLEHALSAAMDDLVRQQPAQPLRGLAENLLRLADENDGVSGVSVRRQGSRCPAEDCEWSTTAWLDSLNLREVVAAAIPVPIGEVPFQVVRALSEACLRAQLSAAGLEGLLEVIWAGVVELQEQRSATGAELSAKFAADGEAFKGEMGFGGLDDFFGGLEALIGSPLLLDGSLQAAMEDEHCRRADCAMPFDTSNGVRGAMPELEWEFVVAPDAEKTYVERGGEFVTRHPDWCRMPMPLTHFLWKMKDVNVQLTSAGQSILITEEVISGRLYVCTCGG